MNNSKGIIYALISSGTFGLIPLFSIPLIHGGMGNYSILFYRFLFSSLMLGAFCLYQKKSFKIDFRQVKRLIILGLLYGATAFGLICSYKYISSGVATTIHFLYPVLVTLIMILFFHERKSIHIFLAVILSLSGVALLCWSGNSVSFVGITFAIATIFTYSVYIVGINKSGVGKIDPLVLTFYILLVDAILFGLIAFSEPTGIEAISDSDSLLRLLSLAFLSTAISDLTLVLAVKYAGSTVTSILGSMEPLVAVAVGIFYFSEDFGLNSFIGLILVLISVILVITSQKQQKTQEVSIH